MLAGTLISLRAERADIRHGNKSAVKRKVYHYPEAGFGLSNRHRRVHSIITVSDSRRSSSSPNGQNRHRTTGEGGGYRPGVSEWQKMIARCDNAPARTGHGRKEDEMLDVRARAEERDLLCSRSDYAPLLAPPRYTRHTDLRTARRKSAQKTAQSERANSPAG